MIVVNTSFEGQRTTGQQRYAHQLSQRLLEYPDVIRRPRSANSNRYAAWFGSQALAVPRGRNETLLTMTSRGPVWHPRHVVVVHDHFVLSNPEWYSGQYVLTHAALLRAQVKRARGLVFVSEWTRERHHRLFGDEVPSIVAPNGVSAPPRDCVAASPIDGPYLLVVGSSDPRKNIDRLVATYSRLPAAVRGDCQLVVVGGADATVFAGSQVPTFDAPEVIRLGYVSDDELWALYKYARALVVPSHAEGFGLPLIEAGALGTPLLVSDLPVFRWIAGEQALYLDPRDEDSIGEMLVRAIEMDAPDVSPDYFRHRFSWDASADAVLRFLRTLEL